MVVWGRVLWRPPLFSGIIEHALKSRSHCDRVPGSGLSPLDVRIRLPAGRDVVAGSARIPAGAQTKDAVTFSKDIAPILQRSCQQCHRPDSVAPMSLLTYEEARPYARAMKARTALRDKRGAMPPVVHRKERRHSALQGRLLAERGRRSRRSRRGPTTARRRAIRRTCRRRSPSRTASRGASARPT